MATCRECGAPIVFVRMAETGRIMPCNPGPDDRANVAHSRANPHHGGRVITDDAPLDPATEAALLAHWATCTSPDAVRRRERKTPERTQPGLF